MRKVLTSAVVTLAVAATLATTQIAASAGSAGANRPVAAYGLTGDGTRVVPYAANGRPVPVKESVVVSGLVGDTALVGIDFRVQDGALYGVGNAGGVYTVSTTTRVATKVLTLTVPLQGTSFGVDFNPAANALRIVSNTGQNLRQPFATAGAATIADTPLTTPPTAGTTTGVTGAAYTNNDLVATTGTTLFDLSTTTDSVLVQSPANNGTLATAGSLTVDAGTDAGFDIAFDPAAGTNSGSAVLTVDGRSGLYSVDLLTGRTDLRATFADVVTDLAVPLAQV